MTTPAKPPAREMPGPGHFICAERCRFIRHTHAGKWCISTVGNLHYEEGGPQTTVGFGRTHETMVFNVRARKRRWESVDYAPYNSDADAARGHAKMVRKYLKGPR